MMQPYTRDLMQRGIAAGLVEIGEHTYGRPFVHFPNLGHRLICGRYCSFADDVHIYLGGNHRPDWVTTYPFPAFAEAWPEADGLTGHHVGRGDVVIGNDVWIGSSATIASGVTIGDGAVIGTRAMVTKDVPPYAVVAGNPARVVRLRFDELTISALLEIAWWNWPEEKISAHIPLLLSGDVQAFIKSSGQLIGKNRLSADGVSETGDRDIAAAVVGRKAQVGN